jgi:hypothetical protein
LFAKKRPRELKHWVWIGLNLERSIDYGKHSFAQMRESGVRAMLPEMTSPQKI